MHARACRPRPRRAGIAEHSHIRKSNYFYYNCITGHFLRDNCPSYLREDNFARLQVRGSSRSLAARRCRPLPASARWCAADAHAGRAAACMREPSVRVVCAESRGGAWTLRRAQLPAALHAVLTVG